MNRLLNALLKRGYNAEIRHDLDDDYNDTFIDVYGISDDYVQIEFSEQGNVKGTLLSLDSSELFIESRKVNDVATAIESLKNN